MSQERIVNALLTAEPSVAAIVGTRIFPVVLPQNFVVPAVGYMQDSRRERVSVSLTGPVHVTAQMTVIAMARDYPSLVALVSAVRKALANQLSGVENTENLVVRPMSQGEDQYDADLNMFSRASTFLLYFTERP
jgi:hypothetical protein